MAKSVKNTKEVIRRHKLMKNREHNGQKFEDTKGLIRKFEDTKGLSRGHKSMTTENTMAKSLKIPKG